MKSMKFEDVAVERILAFVEDRTEQQEDEKMEKDYLFNKYKERTRRAYDERNKRD